MRLASTLWLVVLVGCGGSANPSDAAAPHDANGSAKVVGRLQGTWEIVRYQSRDPIPAEAMPLMGEMFEDLRLSVHHSAWQVDGKDSPFEIVGEDGDSFRLKTGGMFDNAACKLNSKDEWEVVDDGPTWPGTTVLKRSR